MDLINTFKTVKDNKLNRPQVKDFSKVIVDSKGTTFGEFQKRMNDLELKHTKLNEEFLNLKSKYIQNQSDQLESMDILTKKIEALENEISALLSVNK